MSKMMNVETQTVALIEKVPPVLAYPHQHVIPRAETFNGSDHLFLGKEHGTPASFSAQMSSGIFIVVSFAFVMFVSAVVSILTVKDVQKPQ